MIFDSTAQYVVGDFYYSTQFCIISIVGALLYHLYRGPQAPPFHPWTETQSVPFSFAWRNLATPSTTSLLTPLTFFTSPSYACSFWLWWTVLVPDIHGHHPTTLSPLHRQWHQDSLIHPCTTHWFYQLPTFHLVHFWHLSSLFWFFCLYHKGQSTDVYDKLNDS